MKSLYSTAPTRKLRKHNGAPLNSPDVLKLLRTKYRVPQPKGAKQPLIRALKAELEMPIYYHERLPSAVSFRTGTSPTQSVYENGALYVNTEATRVPNCLLHELCHAIVARKLGALGETNFGLEFNISRDDREEVDSCMTEFYLSFMSGYYTWSQLCGYVCEYSFDDTLDFDEEYAGKDSGLDQFSKESVVKLMTKCRDVALGYPGVAQACGRLHISVSEEALTAKMDTHWRI